MRRRWKNVTSASAVISRMNKDVSRPVMAAVAKAPLAARSRLASALVPDRDEDGLIRADSLKRTYSVPRLAAIPTSLAKIARSNPSR